MRGCRWRTTTWQRNLDVGLSRVVQSTRADRNRKGGLTVAAERLKFRCYQCNQLLAAAPAKVGSIVSCPKCKADLLVPGASSRGGPSLTQAPPKPQPAASTFLDEITAALPAEVADLRPEDLRVEAEFFESLTRAPERPQITEPSPAFVPEPAAPFPWPESQTPETAAQPAGDFASAARPSPAALRLETPSLMPRLADTPPVLAQASDDAPPIEIEPPTILPPGREIRPIREVVMPASVVLAWSLFGLIGIAASFIAGLMIGHYIWVTH
jgi:hypothetical protein